MCELFGFSSRIPTVVSVLCRRALCSAAVWVASVPLTDEPWRALQEGEAVVIRSGAVHTQR
jgi:predicted glutamine amidotransferase